MEYPYKCQLFALIPRLEVEVLSKLSLIEKTLIVSEIPLYYANIIEADSEKNAVEILKSEFLTRLSKDPHTTIYDLCDKRIYNKYIKLPFWYQILEYNYDVSKIIFESKSIPCSVMEYLSMKSLPEVIKDISQYLKANKDSGSSS